MSDAARAKTKDFLNRYETDCRLTPLAELLDAFAAEQTAAEAARHADCCVDRQELAQAREQTAALRAALTRHVELWEQRHKSKHPDRALLADAGQAGEERRALLEAGDTLRECLMVRVYGRSPVLNQTRIPSVDRAIATWDSAVERERQ